MKFLDLPVQSYGGLKTCKISYKHVEILGLGDKMDMKWHAFSACKYHSEVNPALGYVFSYSTMVIHTVEQKK